MTLSGLSPCLLPAAFWLLPRVGIGDGARLWDWRCDHQRTLGLGETELGDR
jgi:hypothetical protein